MGRSLFQKDTMLKQHNKFIIEVNDKRGILRGPINVTMLEKVRAMPGRKRWNNNIRPPELLFEPSEANISFIKEHWPEAEWIDETANKNLTIIDEMLALRQQSMADKLGPIKMPDDYQFKAKADPPFKQQIRCFMLSRDMEYYALFMEQATGKTRVLIDTAAYLWSKGKIDGFCVITLNGVHHQWVDEQIPLWMPEWVQYTAFAMKSGNMPIELLQPATNMRILSANFESLKSDTNARLIWRFLRSGRMMLIIDESQKIKAPAGKFSREIRDMADLAVYRRIATGTPIAKGLEDKYAQYRFLSPFILGHNTYTSFKNNYCIVIDNKIRDYRNIEQFQARIAPYTFRCLKSDVMDLPPKIGGIANPNGPLKRFVELTPEQRKHYNNIRQDALTELSDGSTIVAPRAIQKLMRLQQILCGYLPREDGTLEHIPNNRIQSTLDLIEQAQGKVVIWARFVEDIESLSQTIGEECVTYYGKTSDDERELNKKLFNDPKSDKRILIANQQSGGAGLNLQFGGVDTIIYYSNSFAALDRWQSEDRTHRPGMTVPQTFYDLVARGTVDTAILANLRRKKDISDLALSELEAMFRLAA